MNIKRFIFYCIPYKLAIDRKNRNKYFEKDYLKYHEAGLNKEFDTSLLFQSVVSVCGYGYTGSGAVIDLLREYSDCKVIGGVDKEGSATSKKEAVGEIDILRLAGGLFEIEKYIGSNNPFHNDALINRLIKLFDDSPIINFSDNKEYAFSFLNNILDLVLPNLSRSYYNLHLKDSLDETSSIYYLKNMSVTEYRHTCRCFLYSLLNSFNEVGKDVLVADQLFADMEFDAKRDLEYLPCLKTITVYRDPRDVFEFACAKKIQWIPYYSVDKYIAWLEIQYRKFNSRQDILNIRFEDLVFDYESCVGKIEDYLAIDSKCHIHEKLNFNPKLSCQNIGIWKNSLQEKQIFKKIEDAFPLLCYQE